MGSRIAAHFANAGFPVDLLDVVPARSAQAECGGPRRNRERGEAAAGGLLHGCRQSAHHTRQFRGRSGPRRALRMDRRSGGGESRNQALASGAAWLPSRAPGSIVSTNTSGIPAGADLRGLRQRVPAAFSGHALLQSAALPASGGSHPGSGNASAKCWTGWRNSAICTSARASCRARIRRTSSAIASAASSGRKSASSPTSAISPWRKWTR